MKTLLTSFALLALLGSAAAAQTDASQTPVGTAGGNGSTGTGNPVPPAAATLPPDYRLVPGDKLRVEVYKDTQLSQTLQVRPDGKITLPLANDVQAAGKTPIQLRDTIVESLRTYISNPTVTVIVVETVPAVVYVMGEVNSAGPQSLQGNVDVIQALAMAGGFKDFAKTKNIMIRRGSEVIRFNYNDAVKGRAERVFLQPGDTVIVP